MSSSSHRSDHCFIDTHTTSARFQHPYDGKEATIFEDFSENHHKLLIDIEASGPGFLISGGTVSILTITLIVTLKNGKKIKQKFPVGPDGSTFNRVAKQFEDVRKIAVKGEGNPANSYFIQAVVQKTFCICCSSKN